MAKVLMLLEGQTEEAFVKRLLAPHLAGCGVDTIPVIATTKRLLAGDKFRGGRIPYPRLRSELQRLLRDSSATCVTTMFDYYGLPPDFPGKDAPAGRTPQEKVLSVEQAWADDLQDRRFLPHLALHEFEGMLFADPASIAASLRGGGLEASLRKIRSEFPTPEDINDGVKTAPSKRLNSLVPGYSKLLHGGQIVERIGLEILRKECPHFASWLGRLESLGSQAIPQCIPAQPA